VPTGKGELYFFGMNIITNKVSDRVVKALVLCGALLIGVPSLAAPVANNAPSFTGGTTQLLSACQNTAINISSRLAIVDSDAGQLEIWSESVAPMHGTLSGLVTSDTSNGALLTPSGITYTPVTGYAGADTFVIQISDGFTTATTTIFVTVRTLPSFLSTLNPPAICDGSLFSYLPVSGTPGATFTWYRAYVPGIPNPAASGTGNPNEILGNSTYYALTAHYVYTITANGCSVVHVVNAGVKPTPRLTSPLYDTVCTGATFNYAPVSGTVGTTYTWARAAVTGIAPATNSGSGNISEALINSSPDPVNVVYAFALSANGCTSLRNLSVNVVPQPPVTSITTNTPPAVCAGTEYRNFGAGIAPPAGVSYRWSVINGDIVGLGNTGQYCLVSFPAAGDALVALAINTGSAHCVINDTFFLNVGATAASTPGSVLYYNYQLIYMDNTQDSYQWGYDNAASLDSNIIWGASFQSFPVTSPDFVNNYYWVLTTKNGCTQKTYYNKPLAISNISNGNAAGLTIYPNPASNVVNVNLNGIQNGNIKVTLTNLLGQSINTTSSNGNSVQFDIATLPAGCYFITCLQNDVKIATAKFIKN
jgi:Secretion system C-terminal sorting domain/PKD-like domain/Bacterial Ig domain